MKKYLLIAMAAMIAWPLFNSCNNPSGDPEKDAKNKLALIEKKQKLEIEILQKQLEVAQFYAEKNDYDGYRKFLKKFNRLSQKINNDKRMEHRDEYKNIEEREMMIEKRIQHNIEQETRDNYADQDDYGGYEDYGTQEVAY